MIAKGNLHAHGANLAAYLTASKDGERAELAELRGFVAGNIRDAFIDVQIQAAATRCEKPFFHAYVRLPAHEHLTPEQWQTAANRIEKRLGFEDQPRAVAFHDKANGETHMHVAWSRIDLDTMKAIDPGLYKNKLKELCRELERDFGLTVVRNERDPEQKARAAGRNEFEQSRRLDTDLVAVRETIRDCWDRSDNGRAFMAALADKGLILARGDRRAFVVIDREGGTHALSKRITATTAAKTRERLADIDAGKLPTVAQGKGTQRARVMAGRAALPAPTQQRTGKGTPAIPSAGRTSAQPQSRPGRARAARALDKAAGGILGAAGKIADRIATGIEQLLGGGPSMPEHPPPKDTAMPGPEEKTPHEQVVSAEEARATRRQALMEKYGGAIETGREAEIEAGVRKRDEDRSR
jgi:MobA/VirD2-like, nuclease domain